MGAVRNLFVRIGGDASGAVRGFKDASRAGANAICELLALKKPNLLIPLSAKASRGDQILNANSFMSQGFSMVLDEDDMTSDALVKDVDTLFEKRFEYKKAMEESALTDSISKIMQLIKDTSRTS